MEAFFLLILGLSLAWGFLKVLKMLWDARQPFWAFVLLALGLAALAYGVYYQRQTPTVASMHVHTTFIFEATAT